jgi:diguanylate cyclase (GGDEF)-like protein/PAS domain S-box-containing protein
MASASGECSRNGKRKTETPLLAESSSQAGVLESAGASSAGDLECGLVPLDGRDEPGVIASVPWSSERRFRDIFDQPCQFVAVLSPCGVVLDINRELMELSGMTRQDAVGRPLWEVLRSGDPATDVDRCREALAEAAEGLTVRFELDLRNASGSATALDVILHPVRDDADSVALLTFEGRDVTASHLTQRALTTGLRDQQELLEAIPAAIFTFDLGGILVWWNRKGEHVTGLSADELRRRPFLELFPADEWPSIRALIETALSEGEAEVEAGLRALAGPATPYHWTAAPLHDASGCVVGVTVAGRDISRRREVEARLREQTEIVEAIQRVGQVLAAELDLPRLLQAVTDVVVGLTGAEFGAFFFNSIDDSGMPQLRFTVAGVPREEFARLPMPHDSPLFGPVFRGEAVVRIDDVRNDPRSMFRADQSPLSSHPPVSSFMALPVVSPTGEVLGGLLCGHACPGQFTAWHERAAIGLAAQAAIALDNARLYLAARQEIANRQRAEEALRESQERLLAALAASQTGTFRWDLRSGIVEGDVQITRLFGNHRGEAKRHINEVLEFIHPDDRAVVARATERCSRLGDDLELEYRVVRDGIPMRWLAAKGRLYRDDAGKPLYLTGACSDITARKLAEESLKESERRFRLLVEHAADAFLLHDAEGRLLDVNQRACQCLGYEQDELLEQSVSDIEVGASSEQLRARLHRMAPGETATFEGAHRRRDGTTFPVEVRTVAVPCASGLQFISLARDITERGHIAAQLEYQASHDVLTGLPNRAKLLERTRATVAEARSHEETMALLLIDLDRFKEINDSYGHHYGDAILRQLNPRLCAAVRETDLVARLGGDEFAVLLPGVDRQGAAQIAERVLARLVSPIEVDGQRFDVGASIGIALFPDHGQNANALLQHADIAMYAAKRSRSGYEVYAAAQDENSPRRLILIAELRRAIEEGQLELHYQPKIDLSSGLVCGAEALVRWRHPRDGLIPPAQFIPLAEQTGLIRPLGHWALEAAVRQCATWHAAGFDVGVAVNLAADNLQDPCLCQFLAGLLSDVRLPPWWLTIEVTESTMMADPFRARAILGWLHETGVRVAIDDFGTGYSSLAYLKDLPVDEVKIDRVFVKEMTTDRQSACITRAVIDLGHNLGLRVVAEGIEDQPTQDLLTEFECDIAQGYHFSRPLPPDEFLAWASGRCAAASILGDAPTRIRSD